MIAIEQLRNDKRMQVPATAVSIGLMLLFPFIVHAVGGPAAGGRWLPLFYVLIAAAILFHPLVGVVAGLVTPFLNHLLTGAPPLPIAVLLAVELVLFALVMWQMSQRWPRFWGAAPLAFLVAKIGSMLLLFVVPLLPAPPTQYFLSSVTTAWPGMLVLLLINFLVVQGLQRAK